VKPAKESEINEKTCATKAQELAEIAKSQYDRACAAASEASRRSQSTFELSLLREENEKLKKELQELQRKHDALARQKMTDRQLEVDLQRLELENKQLRMDLADKNKEDVVAKQSRRGTIQVAPPSSSSSESETEEDVKRNLLGSGEEAEMDDSGTCRMKRWVIVVITVVVGLLCLGIGGAGGFFLAKQIGKNN